MARAPTPQPVKPSVPRVPPLQNGDRLARPEFERRFDATPGPKKAELLEGIVYMSPPPVSHDHHSAPHADLLTWQGVYRARTPGVLGGDNGSLRLDLDNEPQPDTYLMIATDRGGQAKIDVEGYVAGAPELVGEVAASSVSYDMHLKLRVYRRHGVREYLVWRTLDVEIDWFVLRDTDYQRVSPDASGVYRSEVFPGLWLDAPALLRGDLAGVLQTLEQGLASPEHAAFVGGLAEQSK
jgi:Putative restriction endonuclease